MIRREPELSPDHLLTDGCTSSRDEKTDRQTNRQTPKTQERTRSLLRVLFGRKSRGEIHKISGHHCGCCEDKRAPLGQLCERCPRAHNDEITVRVNGKSVGKATPHLNQERIDVVGDQ